MVLQTSGVKLCIERSPTATHLIVIRAVNETSGGTRIADYVIAAGCERAKNVVEAAEVTGNDAALDSPGTNVVRESFDDAATFVMADRAVTDVDVNS